MAWALFVAVRTPFPTLIHRYLTPSPTGLQLGRQPLPLDLRTVPVLRLSGMVSITSFFPYVGSLIPFAGLSTVVSVWRLPRLPSSTQLLCPMYVARLLYPASSRSFYAAVVRLDQGLQVPLALPHRHMWSQSRLDDCAAPARVRIRLRSPSIIPTDPASRR